MLPHTLFLHDHDHDHDSDDDGDDEDGDDACHHVPAHFVAVARLQEIVGVPPESFS